MAVWRGHGSDTPLARLRCQGNVLSLGPSCLTFGTCYLAPQLRRTLLDDVTNSGRVLLPMLCRRSNGLVRFERGSFRVTRRVERQESFHEKRSISRTSILSIATMRKLSLKRRLCNRLSGSPASSTSKMWPRHLKSCRRPLSPSIVRIHEPQ